MKTGRALPICLMLVVVMGTQAQAVTLNVAHHGVDNELGGTQKAANNFWGSPSGPAGGPPASVTCNTTAGATPVAPVAVRPFPIAR